MKYINRCLLCGNYQRTVKLEMHHSDKYLSLISEQLNSVPRIYYQCEKCDFIYLNPIVTESEVNFIYEEYRREIFRKEPLLDYHNRLISLPDEKSEAFSKVMFLKENTEKVTSILDVGCGPGIITYQLKKHFPNCNIEAVEPNKECTNLVRKKLKIKTYNGEYKKGLVSKKYDLIVICDVLEHIHYIKDLAKDIKNDLKKRSYIFLTVPSPRNFGYLESTHEAFNACHLYYFEEQHINYLFKRHGFNIIKRTTRMENGYKDFYLLKYLGA